MVACLAMTSLLGCDLTRSEMLALEIGAEQLPVRVDVSDVCAVGACDDTTVEAALIFNEMGFISDLAWVEMLQYRVDYTLDGLDEADQPPYFAGEFLGDVGVVAGLNEEVPFTVPAAGQRQRDHVADGLGDTARSGTAVLTLAGYDDQNGIVEVASGAFAISFFAPIETEEAR